MGRLVLVRNLDSDLRDDCGLWIACDSRLLRPRAGHVGAASLALSIGSSRTSSRCALPVGLRFNSRALIRCARDALAPHPALLPRDPGHSDRHSPDWACASTRVRRLAHLWPSPRFQKSSTESRSLVAQPSRASRSIRSPQSGCVLSCCPRNLARRLASVRRELAHGDSRDGDRTAALRFRHGRALVEHSLCDGIHEFASHRACERGHRKARRISRACRPAALHPAGASRAPHPVGRGSLHRSSVRHRNLFAAYRSNRRTQLRPPPIPLDPRSLWTGGSPLRCRSRLGRTPASTRRALPHLRRRISRPTTSLSRSARASTRALGHRLTDDRALAPRSRPRFRSRKIDRALPA